MPHRSGALAFVLILGACRAPTQVVIELRGTSALDGATVEVTVHGADGSQELAPATLPASGLEIDLVPRGGDAARRFVVDLMVRPNDGPERAIRQRGRFTAGRRLTLPVWIDAPPVCTDVPSPDCAPLPITPGSIGYTGSVHAPSSLTPTFRWQAVSGAARYELEIDGDCGAVSPALCPFERPLSIVTSEAVHTLESPLPASTVPPVGARHVWRVRACGGECSAWSEPRVLEVGRQRTDFDGDGYADIVAGAENGARGRSFGDGVLVVWRGAPDLEEVELATLSGVSGHCFFGDEVEAAGDLDGDGYSDLLVSAPRGAAPPCTSGELTLPREGGSVFVLFGGPDGLSEEPLRVAAPSAGTLAFGAGLARVGDVDRDGLADFAASGDNAWLTYRGREDRTIAAWASYEVPMLTEGASDGAWQTLGEINATYGADVDRDGRDDWASARPDGVTWIAAGTPTLLDGPDGVEGFSRDVALTDLDGDGASELAVGSCPGRYSEPGEGDLDGASWIAERLEGPFRELTYESARGTSGYYACAIAALGDVDADGTGDLAVAAPNFASGEGRPIVWLEGATRSVALPLAGALNAFSGQHVFGIGDVDGDGFPDFAASAPRQQLAACDCEGGSVQIWRGGPTLAGGEGPDLVLDHPEPTNTADLGRSIAAAFP